MSRLSLAAFFAFVGYWKALGSMAALTAHHAWVAGFPEGLARTVGVLELACAAALLVAPLDRTQRTIRLSGSILIVNQLFALGVHVNRGEAAQAAAQNLVIILLLIFVMASYARRGDPYETCRLY